LIFEKIFFVVIDIFICKDTTDFRITADVLKLIHGCHNVTALHASVSVVLLLFQVAL